MKPLEREFTKGPFTFRQVRRVGNVAMYAKTQNGAQEHYEVIKVRQNPEAVLNGRVIGASEGFPSSERWGQDGFTCQTLERAEFRMDELLDELLAKEAEKES